MRMFLTGNHAAAYGARLARPSVIAAYPITPQSPIYEKLSEWDGKDELGARMMRVESEHTAMAASIAASLAGSRVFTATSSQGLALMHEMLHFASGMRVPVVMVNVNRSLAAPWSFWSDQTDSLSQRDTGWLQLYVSDNQEALDSVIQAFRMAETVFLPVMVVLEAFYTSHLMESVIVPEPHEVDDFLPSFQPKVMLDPKNPLTFNQTVTQKEYAKFRISRAKAVQDSLQVLAEVDRLFSFRFGRSYGPIECYRTDDAEIVLVTAGTIGSTGRVLVDELRSAGKKLGLLRIRLFRPFPKEACITALAGAKKIAVIDRNIEGIFASELKSHLYGRLSIPVFGFLMGVGGTNVDLQRLKSAVEYTESFSVAPPSSILLKGTNE